jgi:hypothetical protein
VLDEQHETEERSWQDSRPLVIAAGVAAVALLGLLVFAVLHIGHRSSVPLPVPEPLPSTTTTASTTPVPYSTSYPRPSVQTSQDGAPPVTGPPPPPEPAGPEPTLSTPTTIYNPYQTATTTPNGGAF